MLMFSKNDINYCNNGLILCRLPPLFGYLFLRPLRVKMVCRWAKKEEGALIIIIILPDNFTLVTVVHFQNFDNYSTNSLPNSTWKLVKKTARLLSMLIIYETFSFLLADSINTKSTSIYCTVWVCTITWIVHFLYEKKNSTWKLFHGRVVAQNRV